MNYYFKVLRTLSFNGRARRAEYWWFVVINAIVAIALRYLSMMLGLVVNADGAGSITLNNNLTQDSTALLEAIYSLLVLIQSVAVNVRRFHDRGLSGWWIVVAVIAVMAAAFATVVAPQYTAILFAVIGVVALASFVISVLPGPDGPNKYGDDPKAAPGEAVAETFA